MKNAKLHLLRQSQLASFPEEFEALQNKSEIKKTSRIYKLSPTLNDDGVIVMDGRINEAPGVTEAVKNPPILSPKNHFVKLLIRYYHEKNAHHGQESVCNNLRQEAWILDCRAAVRSCWANCFECKKRSVKPDQPQMGQIPAARLGESHRPFHHTGVDYFGPLFVTIGRKSYKRWGALFTCLSSRAIHLELVDSMDASDMINSFVRFICVRGKPAHIYSDNGCNFVGANREMKESFRKFSDEIRKKMLYRDVDWHYIPPSSPFMGGAWESLVKIVKRILTTMMKEQQPRESTMRTLFAEVMEIVNNRPLTYASSNPDDPYCITPNSILRLVNLEGPTVPGTFQEGDKYRKLWRYGQFLADEFWKHWIKSYLPKLAKRQKWHSPVEPLKIGDLVIVVDDQLPRSAWKKGLIVAVYPGKDKQVRVADVRVAHVNPDDPKKKVSIGVYRRPAAKICRLGINVASSRCGGEMAAVDWNIGERTPSDSGGARPEKLHEARGQ